MIKCLQCGKVLEANGIESARVAIISGSVMGDEYTDSYLFCAECQVYTMEVCHDRFLGPEEIAIKGPLSKEKGDEQVSIIKRCLTPWDKKCRCEAHQEYFRGMLD